MKAAAVVILSLVSLVLLAPSANPAGPLCLVSNERTKDGARSLQEAIDSAASGDTLIIKGTCFGTSDTQKDLTLQGVSNKRFGVATLDGGGATDPVLSAASYEGTNVVINDLTITHGGGLGIFVQGSAILTRTIVSENRLSGIDAEYGSISVTDSAIRGNHGVGITGFRNSLTVTRSTVSENDRGGLGALALFVRDSTVSGNGGAGVGVGFDGYGSVINSTISGNGGSGVGLYAASISLESSTITGNSTSGSGGGINASGGAGVSVSDSTITGNTAQLDGGGIDLRNGGSALVTNSTVSGNAAGRYGGGIFVGSGEWLSLIDSTLSGNTATSGGGIYVDGSSENVSLTGTNTFFNNVPDDCVGVAGC
jgi:parallel beta-helix repeat protein